MATTVALIGSVVLVIAVTWLIYRSNRVLRQLVVLPFNPLLVPAENAFKVVLLAFVMGLMVLRGNPLAAYGLVRPMWSDLWLGCGIGVGSLVVVNIISTVAMHRWGATIYSNLVVRAIVPRHASQWPAVAVAMALAVVLEEALFRALPLGSWSPPLQISVVVIGSSVLFGILHTVQGTLGAALAVLLGIVLALSIVWTGSVWTAVMAHYVFNLAQLGIAARWPHLITSAAQPVPEPSPLEHKQYHQEDQQHQHYQG